MHGEDERVPLPRLLVERPHQNALEREAIARLERHDLLLRHPHRRQPRIAVGQALQRRPAALQHEDLGRMLRRVGHERHRAAVLRHVERREGASAGGQDGLATGTIHLDCAEHRLHTFVADEGDCSSLVAERDRAHVAHVAGQHVLQRAAVGRRHQQAPGRRVVDVLFEYHRDTRAVGTPRDLPQLAGVVQIRDHAPAVGVDDVHASHHQVVVHERRGRKRYGKAVAGGAPRDCRGQAGQLQLARRERRTAGVDRAAAEVGDEHADERVPLYTFWLKPFFSRSFRVFVVVARGECHAQPVGAPRVRVDVSRVAQHAGALHLRPRAPRTASAWCPCRGAR